MKKGNEGAGSDVMAPVESKCSPREKGKAETLSGLFL